MLTAGLSEEGQPVFHTLTLKLDPRQRCEARQAAQGHHHKAQRPVESVSHATISTPGGSTVIIHYTDEGTKTSAPTASQSVGLKPGFHSTPDLITPHILGLTALDGL